MRCVGLSEKGRGGLLGFRPRELREYAVKSVQQTRI
jgi:hypothetical protein